MSEADNVKLSQVLEVTSLRTCKIVRPAGSCGSCGFIGNIGWDAYTVPLRTSDNAARLKAYLNTRWVSRLLNKDAV